jgi:LuxR family maltose regulon positive regulatory protein
MTADLSDLKQAAAHLLKLAGERNLPESIGWAHYFQGCAAYQADDLEEAEAEFAAVVGQKYIAHSFTFSQSAFGLASVYLAQGAGDRAQSVAESVVTYALEINNTRVLGDARACQAWLALKQGRYAEARRWAETVDPLAPLVPLTTFHVAAITLAKVLLASGTPSGLREGTELLARLRAFAESQHNTRTLIEVLALQALAESAAGRKSGALRYLAEAIGQAQPGGFVRVFVDLGPELAALLSRLRPEGALADFAAHVLHAFSSGEPKERPSPPAGASSPKPIRSHDSLTDREMDVLKLLACRQSAKEIAHQLIISDRTVKRHTANIYQKLGVNSRHQAVMTAEALGILSSPVRIPE